MRESIRSQPVRLWLAGVLLVGGSFLLHAPARHLFLTVLRAPFRITTGTVKILLNLPSLPALSAENERLRHELTERESEVARLREAVRHGERAAVLQETAGGVGPSLVAQVIGRSAVPTQHTVLLDQGSRQGLSRDTILVDAAGVVGRVAEAHPSTALAMLLTDPESRVAALVERSRESGLLAGRGSGRCELIYLEIDADVQPGDRVVTAGLGGAFPKGLLLGIIDRVTRDQQAGTSTASVAPAARLGQLEEVLCVLRAGPAE